MLEVILISLAVIMLLGGILGAIVPVLPGPPLSYVGLLLVHFTSKASFSIRLLLIMGTITILITLLDLVLPLWATRRSGGSRQGMYGAAIGMFLGIFFFPPLGIIIGPFLGAFLAETALKKTSQQALKAAIGSFIGLLTGTILKLIFSLVITWYALKPLLCSLT